MRSSHHRIAVLLTTVILTFGPIHEAAGQAGPAGEVIVAWHVTIAPTWFDPSSAPPQITPFGTLYAIHDALARPLPNQKMGPSLAESWTESPDGLTYEFKLRRGLKFHNGDPVTTEDVKFSFERYKGAGAKEFQTRVRQVEIVDPLTIRFRLNSPWPDFMTFYGTTATGAGIVVPKKYLTQALQVREPHAGGRCGAGGLYGLLAARAQRQATGAEERTGWQHAPGDAQDRRSRYRRGAGRS